MTLKTILTLPDADLNAAIANAMGYTYAGPFRGHAMYHPPGQRTSVVPLPDYVHDWNALMPLLLGCWRRLPIDIGDLFGDVNAQRTACELVLADLVRGKED